MTARRRVGACRGLLLAALVAGGGVLAPAAVTGQPAPDGSCTGPLSQLDSMEFTRTEPQDTDALTVDSLPVDVRFAHTGTTPPLDREDGQIQTVTARLRACADRSLQALPEESASSTGATPARSLRLRWTASGFRANGPYELVLEATGRRSAPQSTQSSRVVIPFSLAIEPVRPQVRREVSDGVVKVSWTEGRELDLLRYEVRRAPQGSADYKIIENGVVAPTVTSVTDRPGAGAWKYNVIAVRRGADAKSELRSDPSDTVTAEVERGGGGRRGGVGQPEHGHHDRHLVGWRRRVAVDHQRRIRRRHNGHRRHPHHPRPVELRVRPPAHAADHRPPDRATGPGVQAHPAVRLGRRRRRPRGRGTRHRRTRRRRAIDRPWRAARLRRRRSAPFARLRRRGVPPLRAGPDRLLREG